MTVSTLSISLPETMRKFVEEKISSEGYGTSANMFASLFGQISGVTARILRGLCANRWTAVKLLRLLKPISMKPA